jgi:glycerol-3-phosphate dehydrogenase (NAD(P)+)
MGGEEMSAYGLAHLGDYEATVFSKYSRNRAYGESFVSGAPIQGLAEGVSTSHAMMQLAKKYGVELPISEAVYDMIYHDISPDEIAERLFARGLKKEF